MAWFDKLMKLLADDETCAGEFVPEVTTNNRSRAQNQRGPGKPITSVPVKIRKEEDTDTAEFGNLDY